MSLITTIAFLALVASRDQGKIAAYAAVGACIGVYLFFCGFKMLQLKRLILNTPTSKVRSASMGLVELSGMPVGPSTIPAGITGDPCFYYRATASKRVQSGNSSEWKQVADESIFVPFFLQDDTGRMLVNSQGADMDVHRNFKDEFGGSLFSTNDMPMGSVRDFLLRYGLSGEHVRLEEYCIKPDYPLFVLGTLGENIARWETTPERHVSSASSSLSVRLGSRPMNSSLLQMFGVQMKMNTTTKISNFAVNARASQTMGSTAAPPTSSWASISMDEVHPPTISAKVPVAASVSVAQSAPPQRIAQEIPSRSKSQTAAVSLPDTPPLDLSASSGFDLHCPVAISKGGAGAPFTISCESQRELVSSLGWKSAACIWGGPALAVTCVYILLLTLGVL
jgi:E3 Ubiquitin ligase